jgi:hypothetical protein
MLDYYEGVSCLPKNIGVRVGRFLQVQHTKTGKMYRNCHKVCRMAVQYADMIRSKALKLYTGYESLPNIWQPCTGTEPNYSYRGKNAILLPILGRVPTLNDHTRTFRVKGAKLSFLVTPFNTFFNS